MKISKGLSIQFKNPTVQIFIAFFLFFAAYSALGIFKHLKFETGRDLALYDQSLWLYSRFLPPISSFREANVLLDHFNPSFALLTPLYWLLPSPLTLIVIQVFFICLSAFLIYYSAKKIFQNHLQALLFSAIYLFYIGFQSALDFEVHMPPFAVPFLTLSIYSILYKRWILYWLSFFITLGLYEDIFLIFIALGLYIAVILKLWKVGLLTVLISFLWYQLAFGVIIPLLSGQALSLLGISGKANFIVSGFFTNPLGTLENFFTPLGPKVQTLFILLGSFGFFPLLSPLAWLVFPTTLDRFLSDPPRWSVFFHYSATAGPILTFAALQGIEKTGNYFESKFRIARTKVFWFGIIFAGLITIFVNRPGWLHPNETIPLRNIFKRSFYKLNNLDKSYYPILSMIPKNASVSTQFVFLPHLSHRREIYSYHQGKDTDYIFLSRAETSYPKSQEELNYYLRVKTDDPRYQKVFNDGVVVLVKKL